jgi:hypothetical protein
MGQKIEDSRPTHDSHFLSHKCPQNGGRSLQLSTNLLFILLSKIIIELRNSFFKLSVILYESLSRYVNDLL